MKDEQPPRPLTVKDMDVDDQPRERALRYGISTLSTADLWALILRTGLPGKPITQLCRDLMRDNEQSLFKLERKSLKEIMTTKGIGQTKGLQILAAMEITRRYNREKVGEKYVITSSQAIYDLMRSEIGNLSHEEIWAIYLGRRNDVILKKRISTGSATASIFDVKSILKEALLIEAQGLALVHNHPSGNLVPSGPDDQITRKMKEGAQIMDFRMVDHLIISASGFYSYYDSGRL
ncbi:MAG: DNA repair protein RadC [Bacteroidales bacterium]|nr:DNA repair protein RadC [Bacteroidales bacterium]MBD5189981.1 DNA repair protein RadC [Bacteroidales bacterium]